MPIEQDRKRREVVGKRKNHNVTRGKEEVMHWVKVRERENTSSDFFSSFPWITDGLVLWSILFCFLSLVFPPHLSAPPVTLSWLPLSSTYNIHIVFSTKKSWNLELAQAAFSPFKWTWHAFMSVCLCVRSRSVDRRADSLGAVGGPVSANGQETLNTGGYKPTHTLSMCLH